MVNEIEQEAPLAGSPEITQVDSAESKISFDGPAVPR